MHMMICLACIASLGATAARAAPCDRLSAGQRKLAHTLFKATHPYDCCDDTLDRCLKQFKVCKLAKRLRDEICRRLIKGHSDKQIRGALDRRARSMTVAIKNASFDLSTAPLAGDRAAKVTVVAYACARCPFCSKVLPDLHRLVESSGLKGKVKLYFRPFPIRDHPGSLEGGLAFVAAARLGAPWPYLLKLYAEYDSFSVDKLAPWAARVGIKEQAFKSELKSAAARKDLVESKKEGLRNGVTATPTLFINGRKYLGDMDHESLLDVLDEESDRVSRRQFCDR